MVHLPKHLPLTPLDALRTLLDSPGSAEGFQSRLASCIQAQGWPVVAELGPRLGAPGTGREVRKAILELVPRFDWPQWVPHLQAFLAQESDLGLFDAGCAALGALGLPAAKEALEVLKALRPDLDHQVILDRELAQYLPQQSPAHYLGRLLEGAKNPRLAAQGARMLAILACEDGDVLALQDAFQQGDALARRLALRAIAAIPGEAGAAILMDLFREVQDRLLEQRNLAEAFQRVLALPKAHVREEFLLQAAAERLGERGAEALAALKQAIAQEDGRPAPALEALQRAAQGAVEPFIVDALALLVEGKVARLAAFLSETGKAIEATMAGLVGDFEQAAEGLVARTLDGEIPQSELYPLLAECFRAKLGGDGFLQTFLWIVPPDDAGLLDEVLREPDLHRRMRCLEALGNREEDALAPFFLKAVHDPIIDVGQLAMRHLGKLPSAFPMLLAQLESGQPDQVRTALNTFGENREPRAAEPILHLIQGEIRDDLMVEAVEALTQIRVPRSAPVLLAQLHDGKPLSLQLALARALGELAVPEASLGLLQKSVQLKHPEVLILALEGSLSAFSSFEAPMPAEHLPALVQLLDRCCDEREGEGQRLRAMLAAQDIYAFDQALYDRLKDRFSDFLFDMRTKEAWDRESNDQVANVIKELTRRSANLGHVAQKEAEIQGRLQGLPPEGAPRVEALLALRETLADPELLIRPDTLRRLADFVAAELAKPGLEWRELVQLCGIGGLTHQPDLVPALRDVLDRATGLGLKSAAREALLRLGQTEADLARRAPVRSILALEPSAFFRKRLLASLGAGGAWTLREAASRTEAEALLAAEPVDLLLSESQDAQGELLPWLEAQWGLHRFRYAILSTANRDLGESGNSPWLIGILYKPYPGESLIRLLQS